jgi:hypothetical protein
MPSVWVSSAVHGCAPPELTLCLPPIDPFPVQLLRVIDSLQLAAQYPVATPADWKQGEEVMIAPRVSDDEAEKLVGGVAREAWGSCIGRLSAESPCCLSQAAGLRLCCRVESVLCLTPWLFRIAVSQGLPNHPGQVWEGLHPQDSRPCLWRQRPCLRWQRHLRRLKPPPFTENVHPVELSVTTRNSGTVFDVEIPVLATNFVLPCKPSISGFDPSGCLWQNHRC